METSMDKLSNYLTTKQAAKLLQLSPAALTNWRSKGGGPIYYKIGRSIRYSISDLDAFLKARKLAHTASRADLNE